MHLFEEIPLKKKTHRHTHTCWKKKKRLAQNFFLSRHCIMMYIVHTWPKAASKSKLRLDLDVLFFSQK